MEKRALGGEAISRALRAISQSAHRSPTLSATLGGGGLGAGAGAIAAGEGNRLEGALAGGLGGAALGGLGGKLIGNRAADNLAVESMFAPGAVRDLIAKLTMAGGVAGGLGGGIGGGLGVRSADALEVPEVPPAVE